MIWYHIVYYAFDCYNMVYHIVSYSCPTAEAATPTASGRARSYILYNSLIADSSDKGSDRRQKKSNLESKVTLQILSTVDSKGTNIGARKLVHHNVTNIVRNGRFVHPDHRTAVTLDISRTTWTFVVSVRNVRRIRNVESSNVAVGGLCLFRVLSRSRSTENYFLIEPFTYCFVT